VRIVLKLSRHCSGILVTLVILGLFCPGLCSAQSRISLQEAVDQALQSRASLKAEAQRVAAAQGLKRQAGAIPNPEFRFENQNLRPGQTYTQDVDTLAVFTQPLDVLGKRGQRIAVADQAVGRTQAEYELSRRQVMQRVKLTYWVARGAQETRDLLNATVANFQKIVDFHSAQLSQGAISEQDFLRVRLESERLKITANLAAIEATHARVQLLREMGQTTFSEIVLTEALDAHRSAIESVNVDQVLTQRVEMRVERALLEEAQANSRLQDVSARPDLNLIYGYKRTQLVDTTTGTNTAIAGLSITLPITNRNQGNREAASAEVRRQQQLLVETEAGVRADYYGAVQEYDMRRHEVVDTLQPLREHGAAISEIAQQAYARGGTDLLRLLDAQRARIDAELAWVQGMVEYQQSIVNFEVAEGVSQ
jgi:cobalt-zinc-cadmium efflux system outer membrane protein